MSDRKRGVDRPKGRGEQCRVWLPSACKAQAVMCSRLMGYHALGPYLRRLIENGVATDMLTQPRSYLNLRPHSTVYNIKSGRFHPLAQSSGGERVWVLAVGPTPPKSLGGGVCYLCDIVRGNEDGVEGRGVVVLQGDCS